MGIAVSSMKSNLLDMSLDAKGAVDLKGEKLEMDSSISIGLRGKDTSYRSKIYMVDSVLYTSDKDAGWKTKTLSGEEIDAVWGKQLDMLSASRYLDIFPTSDADTPQLVEKDGVTCYLIEMTPDPEVFNERLLGLISQGGVSTQVLPFDTPDIFNNARVRFWIDADTYHLTGYEMTADLTLEDNGSVLNGNIENTGRFYDFDTELAIEAPN